jgi:hypothetical protein
VYSRFIDDDKRLESDSGNTSLSSTKCGNGKLGQGRRVYLPLDRSDGSNPVVRVHDGASGIFIYRLLDGETPKQTYALQSSSNVI